MISHPVFGNYFLPQYQPSFNEPQKGKELCLGLYPQHPEVIRLFESFIDVSALEKTISPPLSRSEKNFHFDDAAQMKGLKILIQRGLIQVGTLIISDTGHDLTTAAFFMREYAHGFNIQSVFYYPMPLYQDRGNYDRLISQVQDWGEDLHFWQLEHARFGTPDIIFLGLEGHRKGYDKKYLYEIPWKSLPTKKRTESNRNQ